MFWLPGLSLVQWIVYAALGLVLIGLGTTMVMLVMRTALACLGLSSWALNVLWQWLTGKPPDSHGTAHLAREAEITAKGLFTPGGIRLATWQGTPLYAPLGSHIAVIAPPRSWKSTSFLAPAIADYDGSCLVNDPRAELWAMTCKAREAMGPTYRFSPTQKLSAKINILDSVRWDEPEGHGDVQRVIWTLTAPEPGEVLTPFMQEARPLLEGIAWDRHAADEGSLPAMLAWMVEPSQSMKQKMQTLLSSPLPVVRSAGRRFLDKSERLQASVWSAALSTLTIFGDPLIAEHTASSDVALTDVQHGSRPISVYLSPPFADVARLRPLLAAIMEQLCALFSAQQDTPRQRVGVFLDEMGNLGRLAELARGHSYLQGCGVQIIHCWQNLPQVEQTYGRGTPLLASVGVRMFYTPNDQTTAEAISEEIGRTTARLHPETQHQSAWGILTSTSIGTSEHERRLLTADECRRLEASAALIFSTGTAPILARKLGSPAPERIDLTTPLVKRVAAVVGALVLSGSLGAGAWAVWPRTTTPPRLSLTSEAGGGSASHQAERMHADTPEAIRQAWIDTKIASLEHQGWPPQRLDAQRELWQGLAQVMNETPDDREVRVLAESSQHRGRFHLWRTQGNLPPMPTNVLGYPTLAECQTALTAVKASSRPSPLWAKVPPKFTPPPVSYSCSLIDDAT